MLLDPLCPAPLAAAFLKLWLVSFRRGIVAVTMATPRRAPGVGGLNGQPTARRNAPSPTLAEASPKPAAAGGFPADLKAGRGRRECQGRECARGGGRKAIMETDHEGVKFEDDFEIMEKDPDGKKFDRGECSHATTRCVSGKSRDAHPPAQPHLLLARWGEGRRQRGARACLASRDALDPAIRSGPARS